LNVSQQNLIKNIKGGFYNRIKQKNSPKSEEFYSLKALTSGFFNREILLNS